MNCLRMFIPPKIFEVIERAGIATSKQVIILSVYDIQKLTNLNRDDIMLLKNLVTQHQCPECTTCDNLLKQNFDMLKVTTGCKGIDSLLSGGFRKGTISEIYGESGSGKTQIALQAAAHNWPKCSVYICTEDLFPIKRFEDIKKGIENYDPQIDYGKHIFVEHITESKDLLSCIRVRLKKLLLQNEVSLIVIDSVAAPFRNESTRYIQRAEDLKELAISLISIAQDHNLAILCINQVTASFDGPNNVLPSLGLAWSNMVSTRLYLKKSKIFSSIKLNNMNTDIREISVIFAPDLPNNLTNFIITSSGLQDYKVPHQK